MKRIKVAVGLIFDQRKRVLVGQRTVQDLYFRKWEFPGGKLEAGESAADALRRELSEELGIQAGGVQPFMQLFHDYPDRHVELSVMLVTDYQGEVCGREGQALQWLAPKELPAIDFLQGNRPIVERLLNEYPEV